MKQNNKLLTIFSLAGFLLFSCNKTEPNVAFTHTTMKPWFDTYCNSCHASGGSAAKEWKYDSNDFNNTIKNHISSIHSTVATQKSMPQGSTLSAVELQKFVDWYNAGYPIN